MQIRKTSGGYKVSSNAGKSYGTYRSHAQASSRVKAVYAQLDRVRGATGKPRKGKRAPKRSQVPESERGMLAPPGARPRKAKRRARSTSRPAPAPTRRDPGIAVRLVQSNSMGRFIGNERMLRSLERLLG